MSRTVLAASNRCWKITWNCLLLIIHVVVGVVGAYVELMSASLVTLNAGMLIINASIIS